MLVVNKVIPVIYFAFRSFQTLSSGSANAVVASIALSPFLVSAGQWRLFSLTDIADWSILPDPATAVVQFFWSSPDKAFVLKIGGVYSIYFTECLDDAKSSM